MQTEQNYIDILIQSLNKKLAILQEIQEKNEKQRVLLLDDNLTPEDFENNINEKARLIESLELLDEGFDDVYSRVREALAQDKEAYKEQIATLQEQIRQTTALSNSIQAEEQRNYQLAQRKFGDIKKQIREVKASHSAVQQYYRNMMKINYVDPQFLDDKK